MLGIERRGELALYLAALDQRQFARSFLVILDHFFRERLCISVRLLGERGLARLDLKHVADRDLVHEVLRRWWAGGGVWEKATEANSPQPTPRIRVLFMVALPGCITA